MWGLDQKFPHYPHPNLYIFHCICTRILVQQGKVNRTLLGQQTSLCTDPSDKTHSSVEEKYTECPVLIIIIFYLLSSSSPHALLCMVASIMSGCVLVGPSMFHMSAQQKKAARGPCFHIPYYQSDQIIQKTCRCILHSFACLAHWKKKIENWSATTMFHIPCFHDAFHSSV